MKNLLFLLLTLLFTYFDTVNGQTYSNQYKQQYQQDTYDVELYSDWKLSNPGGHDIPSFYWCITRSKQLYNGNYIFDIWFYSNSYILDYYTGQSLWSYTYVSGIYVIVNGKYINKEPVWVTFQDKFTYEGLRIYSINKFPKVRLVFDNPIIP